MSTEQNYRNTKEANYVKQELWGKLELEGLREASKEAIQLIETHKADALLCDIRNITYDETSIKMQIEGMSLLWKMRHLRRIAFLVSTHGLSQSLETTFEQLHLGSKYHAFRDEAEAIAWLNEK